MHNSVEPYTSYRFEGYSKKISQLLPKTALYILLTHGSIAYSALQTVQAMAELQHIVAEVVEEGGNAKAFKTNIGQAFLADLLKSKLDPCKLIYAEAYLPWQNPIVEH